jgi:dTDP-glucose pyrophosphorylase
MRGEDRFGQVIQYSIQDRQTGKTSATGQAEDQVHDDPAQKDEPVEAEQ